MRSKVSYLSAALEGSAGQGATVAGAVGSGVGSAGGASSARAERLRAVLAAVNARTLTQRDAGRRLFMRQLPDANLRDDFERHGWMSPLNAEGVAAFWADMSPEIFGSIAP